VSVHLFTASPSTDSVDSWSEPEGTSPFKSRAFRCSGPSDSSTSNQRTHMRGVSKSGPGGKEVRLNQLRSVRLPPQIWAVSKEFRDGEALRGAVSSAATPEAHSLAREPRHTIRTSVACSTRAASSRARGRRRRGVEGGDDKGNGATRAAAVYEGGGATRVAATRPEGGARRQVQRRGEGPHLRP
jgi:hypothetical protein